MSKKECAYLIKGFIVETVYLQEDEISGKKTIHVNTEHAKSIKNYLDRITNDIIYMGAEVVRIDLNRITIGTSNEPFKRFLFTNMRNSVRFFDYEKGTNSYNEILSNTYTSKREMLEDVFDKVDKEISTHYDNYHDYVKRNSLVKTS